MIQADPDGLHGALLLDAILSGDDGEAIPPAAARRIREAFARWVSDGVDVPSTLRLGTASACRRRVRDYHLRQAANQLSGESGMPRVTLAKRLSEELARFSRIAPFRRNAPYQRPGENCSELLWHVTQAYRLNGNAPMSWRHLVRII